MGRRLLFLAALLFAWVVVPAIPAQATFPGDNGAIAFRRFLNVERTWGAIFTIRPDGRGERQVTNPPFGYVDRDQDVSPDGRKIAFQRETVDCGADCNSSEVFVVNADGSQLRQLTEQAPGAVCGAAGTCNESPAWSPDGRRILFHSNNSQNPDVSANLYTIRPDGTHLRQLTFDTGGTVNYLGSSYSPDGTMITFGRRPETAGAADVFV